MGTFINAEITFGRYIKQDIFFGERNMEVADINVADVKVGFIAKRTHDHTSWHLKSKWVPVSYMVVIEGAPSLGFSCEREVEFLVNRCSDGHVLPGELNARSVGAWAQKWARHFLEGREQDFKGHPALAMVDRTQPFLNRDGLTVEHMVIAGKPMKVTGMKEAFAELSEAAAAYYAKRDAHSLPNIKG